MKLKSNHVWAIEYFVNLITFVGVVVSPTSARTVPATRDICNRFPSMQLCSQQSQVADPSPQRDPSIPTLATSSLSTEEFCRSYVSKFDSTCTGPNNRPSGELSSNPQASGFCDSYSGHCPRTPPTNRALVGSSGNTDPSAPLTNSEKKQYCSTYQQGFYKHCSQATNDPNKVKFCKAYFNYCDVENKLGSPQDRQPTSGQIAQQDSLPGPYPNANNSAVIRAQCEKYKFLGDVYCPGYEVTELRKNCNLYRVYCQGKAPFPGIDGNIGFSKDVWAVQGIPFYPFNDQGSIAGGKVSNVGFGDWGGSYAERSGVSDFWDEGKKVNANWQRGNYMVNEGWNVPLTGISGFKQNGVQLGGLGNPSDWPALASGGLLPGVGSSGAGSSSSLPWAGSGSGSGAGAGGGVPGLGSMFGR